MPRTDAFWVKNALLRLFSSACLPKSDTQTTSFGSSGIEKLLFSEKSYQNRMHKARILVNDIFITGVIP
jgi:hypothetical protein